MIFQTQELIFFSLNKASTASFERYIRLTNKEYQRFALFRLIRENKNTALDFNNIQDLFFILERMELERLANLIVIIDHFSLPCYNTIEKDYSQKIKELILQYPEVKFTFLSFNTIDQSWQNTINLQKGKNCKLAIPYIHSFNLDNPNELELLINGKSNLFDASNLRNLIKNDFLNQMKVGSNYPKSQKSRTENLALCIDEEINQAYFNSYAMFIHGYRAMPVVSYRELEKIVDKYHEVINKEDIKIIIRDYDLQFEDEDGEQNKIHKLRGIKYENDKWHIVPKPETTEKKSKDSFWGKFEGINTFFVSRFDESNISETPNVQPPSLFDRQYDRINNKEIRKNCGIRFNTDHTKAYLRGLPKPVDGLMEFREIEEVEKNGAEIIETADFKITRNEGGHSVSPFITHIAESLIARSRQYYKKGYYMLAALLAKEATEVLNGFHLMLMLDATYLQAIAENAMVMNILGGDEKKLANHTVVRLNQIRDEVNRICRNNPGARKNVLNQIYNDIRQTCRNKEQFKSADKALNMLVEHRYGFKLSSTTDQIKRIFDVLKEKSMTKKIFGNLFHKIWLYFVNFGWMYLLFAGILFLSAKISESAVVIISVLGLLFFILHPLRYVYTLVSSKSKLWTFLILFGFTQLVFTSVYYFGFFNNAAIEKNIILENNLIVDSVVNSSTNIQQELKEEGSFQNLLVATYHTSLLQETAPVFVKYIEYENKDRQLLQTSSLNILLIFQIFTSWIYLGVLIASLYQKLRNE